MSIRDLYQTTITVELPDGTAATFARMTVRTWAELAGKIREERVKEEMKAISAVKDPTIAQQLRLRAGMFEPSYYDLVDDAQTSAGILRLLPFAAIKGGTSPEIAEQIVDLIQPMQVREIMDAIVHAPLGPRIGGNVSEGQSANPTSAESSNPATGESVPTPGSENASTSTGTESVCEFGPPSDSTPST